MNALYRGTVKGKVVELEGDASLPEGTRVTVIPERPARDIRLIDWLREARELRAQLTFTSDSVEIVQRIRQERAEG
jgi:hypothetical protein